MPSRSDATGNCIDKVTCFASSKRTASNIRFGIRTGLSPKVAQSVPSSSSARTRPSDIRVRDACFRVRRPGFSAAIWHWSR
jgi:hypothetical protein